MWCVWIKKKKRRKYVYDKIRCKYWHIHPCTMILYRIKRDWCSQSRIMASMWISCNTRLERVIVISEFVQSVTLRTCSNWRTTIGKYWYCVNELLSRGTRHFTDGLKGRSSTTESHHTDFYTVLDDALKKVGDTLQTTSYTEVEKSLRT